MAELHVWRDAYFSFEHVGTLHDVGAEPTFCYDLDYRGPAISVRLPVKDGEFTESETRAFFAALTPEGPLRDDLARTLRLGKDRYLELIRALNDESIGGLVFTSENREPGANAAYEPVDGSFLTEFAKSPRKAAFDIAGMTRLSLTGAMAKIGLYFNEESRCWYLPSGGAPSTHIVKAGSEAFPHETLNEALCLGAARRCGFDVPETTLIDAEGAGAPLLATRRYDRPFPSNPTLIGCLPKPERLHQEDFCQVCGLPASMKYEPTDGNYLALITSMASRYCANGFGESQLLLEYVLFDYLVGNCDNHLKNFSLLYGENWKPREIAPLYDVVCTTVYESIYTEMGVSFGGSRSILGLGRRDLERAIDAVHLPVKLGMAAFDELASELPGALEQERDALVQQGFTAAGRVAEAIIDGVAKRAAFDYDSRTRKAQGKHFDRV